MTEEIKNYVAPLCVIPPQSVLAGELYQLRQKHKRLRATQAIKDNEAQQKLVTERLKQMGRQDLCV